MADHAGMKPPTAFSLRLAIGLSLLGISASLVAAEPAKPRELLQPPKVTIASPLNDRFALRGSYMHSTVATGIRYDSATGVPGTDLSAERDLGLDDQLPQGTLEMTLRMLQRHRIRADFFQVRREGEVLLTDTIRFGDDTYVANDEVVTKTDVRAFGLTYTYSFLKAERFEFSAGIGLHLIQVEGMSQVPARRLQQNFDAAGPFPTIAVDGIYRITDKFAFSARAQYFGTSVDDADGSLGIYHADLQYRAWRNLAFGFGYTKTSLHFDGTGDSFSGRFALDVKGPEVFARVSF